MILLHAQGSLTTRDKAKIINYISKRKCPVIKVLVFLLTGIPLISAELFPPAIMFSLRYI